MWYHHQSIRSPSFCHMSHVIRKPVMPYANNKGADQPAHRRSLISTIDVRCLDSIISSFYIWNFKPLASFCGCAGRFESYLVENPEDRFSRDQAHIISPVGEGKPEGKKRWYCKNLKNPNTWNLLHLSQNFNSMVLWGSGSGCGVPKIANC